MRTLAANPARVIVLFAFIASVSAIIFSYYHGYITAYGDSESHLNIAKRVIHSLTPGAAQLGGIWLPLPHLFMVPFVASDFLWRSGLAGSIVSSIAYIISTLYIYKISFLVTRRKSAGIIASLVFALNPNILYMQSTPMTELLLICFFTLSTYFFLVHIFDTTNLLALIMAAFFAFCASLTRYDGWFLVIAESGLLSLHYLWHRRFRELEGKLILYVSLAFFGIGLWLLWNYLILGDPLYFTNSSFSAKSQQNNWLARGELPAYKNMIVAIEYYAVTAWRNAGSIVTALAGIGLISFMLRRKSHTFTIAALLLAPFVFNVITLYLGQSVIFIPDLVPKTFEWNLFNVRYGMMMIPTLAFFIGYIATRRTLLIVVTVLLAVQLVSFRYYEPVITLQDGTIGLSASKHPDAEKWLHKNYDGGLVLFDDYARTISVINTSIPMQNIIYIGNKPYWEESLKNPEKYARWVVMQQDDSVWNSLYDDPAMQKHLYTYYQKAYTSPKILIFKRTSSLSDNR